MDELLTWTVVIDFRHNVPSFETVVEHTTRHGAIRLAEEAACAAGWADAEILRVTVYPRIRRAA